MFEEYLFLTSSLEPFEQQNHFLHLLKKPPVTEIFFL